MSGTAFAVPLMMEVFILCASGAGDQKGLAHTLARQLAVGADGHGELDVVLLGEAVQPVQELIQRVIGHVRAHDLGQAVDKDMGNAT